MTNQTVSCWQKASTIATWCQVLIVIVSVLLIRSQLQQQKASLDQQKASLDQQVKLNRAANTQNLVSLITPLNLKTTDREMAELWVKGFDGIDKLPDKQERELQRERYESLLASYMTFYENVYSQNNAELLDPKIYDGWNKDLADFIKDRQMDKVWIEWKGLYRTDFSDYVDKIIASQK